MDELNEFFKINWTRNLPNIFVLSSKKVLMSLSKQNKEWLTGWTFNNNVYILKEKFNLVLKHELCHLFVKIICKKELPTWLNEGLAKYLSGQYLLDKTPSQFANLFSSDLRMVYWESPFAVKLLVEKFGREKLLELLNLTNKMKFDDAFSRIYGSRPSLKFFNLLKMAN